MNCLYCHKPVTGDYPDSPSYHLACVEKAWRENDEECERINRYLDKLAEKKADGTAKPYCGM